MAHTTHATLVTFRMDLRREAEQREILQNVIVPGVRSAPGFVSGTWTLDREAGESVVLVTFDALDHAHAFADSVRAERARISWRSASNWSRSRSSRSSPTHRE